MAPRRTWLWLVLVLLANYLLVRLLIPNPDAPVTVPYTLFKEEVTKGNVEAIFSRDTTITGRFETPVTYPSAGEPAAAPRSECHRGCHENCQHDGGCYHFRTAWKQMTYVQNHDGLHRRNYLHMGVAKHPCAT